MHGFRESCKSPENAACGGLCVIYATTFVTEGAVGAGSGTTSGSLARKTSKEVGSMRCQS
jgi:hypothetical protein